MRIAQVSPLFESIPPRLYGGTERIVSYLTEELVRQGHQVTLFATGDSVTEARLVAICPVALWRTGCEMHDAHHLVLLERLMSMKSEFDVMHFHFDYWHLPLAQRSGVPYVTTLHGRLDLPDLVPLYQTFRDTPVVSISNAQRDPLPWLNWRATVHHGLPPDLLRFNDRPDTYVAFVGRASPEKGLWQAIQIAKRANVPLRIAAAVQPASIEYFETAIRPELDHPLIEFMGELGGQEKEELIANARAVLFPIDWPEPFGVVMIEAMACGTPVVAFRRGSVPEVVQDGVSGFVADDIDGAVTAVHRLDEIDRRQVRMCFEDRFTVERMATEYLEVYSRLIESGRVLLGHEDKAHLSRAMYADGTRHQEVGSGRMARLRARRGSLAQGADNPPADVSVEAPPGPNGVP